MTFSGNMKESKPRTVKDSWESELGYGWSRSGQRRCRSHRPPESTMSVSSDIRFTRRKLSRSCRGCCAALAALLVLLLLAAVAVYLGHMYLFGDPLNRQTFRGSFVASSWGAQDDRDDATEVKGNSTRDVELRQALYDTYANSELRSCFVAAEILALDNVEKGTRIHFEVSFEPIFTGVTTAEVSTVLTRELQAPYFQRLGVLPATLHIEESSIISSQALKEGDSPITEISTTEVVAFEIEEDLRECSPLTLTLCSHLPYNITTYPNLVGHSSKEAMLRDLVAFRELLDAECSYLAQLSTLTVTTDFVCQMLQPRCDEDRLVRPCHAYCRAFHAGCGARLPDRLRPHFDCSRFPDYFGPGSCLTEPDCMGGLQRVALSRRACDAVPDCADASDERSCAHCAAAGLGALRCALLPRCLPAHLRCDGTPDCADGSDEAGCLWVTRSLASWKRETAESTLGAVRSRAGYAVWAERGRVGKVCAAPYEADKQALMSLATSLCTALTFKTAVSAEAVPDGEEELEEDTTEDTLHERARRDIPEYVQIVDPSAPEIAFIKTDCPQRRVIKIVCDQLECGLASARGGRTAQGVEGLPRGARPGDWPWHAALFRTHVHACDAVLIHPAWLITTASCFQGQPKAEWTARLGSVRIQSTTPWQQERRIVGMVRSPVEGSMLAMVRLEEPVEMTDFVRPACLPDDGLKIDEQSICNTLGWTRNRDQLQRVHVVPTAMNTCENVSIATGNGICAEPLYDQDDCDEEEYAGSSMMCFDEKSKHWSLIGVSGWRIACSKIGLGRPRIYDAVTSHIEWIKRTITNSSS
ncbi:atrial natriuretic peptide-converting enzyme isoform X1 [Maniola jurtina]|uniref:atrial natriuretic peptide-converting enzyme isoform X1 n=1 Tax=Maniola jurtina TaxID=191418 RepID=UPI001E6878B5|nr:atrial natriuretic peptide-converting enzyme isoform X1 [Maniola jurtina]